MNIFRSFPSNWLRGPVPPDSAATDSGASPSVSQPNAAASSADMADTAENLGNGPEASPPQHGNSPDKNKDEKNSTNTSEQHDHELDHELVRKAQAGDTKAFDRLVTLHRGKIYAMIVNMVKNEADAWDLAQEAFIKAWKALSKFEARARFSTWLFRISHNVVYDWLRKRRIQSEGELNDEILDADRIDPGAATSPHLDPRPDEAMEQREARDRIRAAIAKLSEEHREVILLREVQGMDYKEIAEATGSSMGTVMSRIHYARKKLQAFLKP